MCLGTDMSKSIDKNTYDPIKQYYNFPVIDRLGER